MGLSSTSLLASATHVSHGMRRHQIFNEHAAKKEEWRPPGERARTLSWSSAAHDCRGKKQPKSEKKRLIQLQVEQIVCLTFIFLPPKKKKVHPCAFWQIESEDESERNPLCAVFKLSRRRSEEHLPQSVRSRSPGWKVGGKERDRRGRESE